MRDDASTAELDGARGGGRRAARPLPRVAHVGSRAAAERAVAGRGARRRPRAAEELPARGRRDASLLAEPPERAAQPSRRCRAPRIAWQDEHLAVVDKPAGLVVHPGAGHARRHARRRARRNGRRRRPGAAGDRAPARPRHLGPAGRRALGGGAIERLSALVRRRALERTYLALVRGRPRSRSGRIEAPIGRDRDDPTRVSLEHRLAARRRHALRGRSARGATTRCSACVSRPAACTRSASTWRRSACPVVGDPVYGVADPALGRQFLHAARLAFAHPFTGEWIEVESPLPPELAGATSTRSAD